MTGTNDKAAAASIGDVLAMARRRETTVRICVAGDLAADAERLAAEIDELDKSKSTSLADGGRRAELAARLDEVIELMKGAEVEFRFRGMGDKAFSDLLAKYPPKEGSQFRFDPDAMAVEFIALSCISHPMTIQEAEALHEVLPEVARNALYNAAWDASRGENVIPTSRAASVTTPASAPR